MVSPETAPRSVPTASPTALDENSTGASGTRIKVATRPATVGATWLELFQPGTPSSLSLEARVRVVADVAGALIQIHENSGVPRQHRRHGRLTPRHVLVGVDGSASLFNAKEPFSKLLPPQPDLGYLAPELLTQTGPATQQSDVFSMGVLLWEALDNGRLFPHRRAAAISRLIARKSLPNPRIEEEWALRLGEVAMLALSDSPDERYPDATALWLALREHLPPPDNARAALAREAQRALKLELTSDIRESPPYLAPAKLLINSTPPSDRDKPVDGAPIETSARYSLRPEPSSRQLANAALASPPESDSGSRSEAARPTARPPARAAARFLSQPPQSEPSPVPSAEQSSPPRSERSALQAAKASTRAPRSERSQPPASQPQDEPRISTLQVNLPRDLVDASLPLYVTSQPAERPFPWGALSFAALIFFGVGAAVAFGAVSALRNPAPVARELATEPRPFIVQAMPATAAPAGTPSGDPNTSFPQPAAVEPATAPPTSQANEPPSAKTPATSAPRAGGSAAQAAPQKRARAPKPKPRAAKPPAAAPPPPPPTADTPEKPSEPLPFVEQPY